MKTFFIIYIIGYVISYGLCKYLRNEDKENPENEWEDVFLSMVASLLSWLWIITVLLVSLIEYIKKNKPPKWL